MPGDPAKFIKDPFNFFLLTSKKDEVSVIFKGIKRKRQHQQNTWG